jgi:hypothetical protein
MRQCFLIALASLLHAAWQDETHAKWSQNAGAGSQRKVPGLQLPKLIINPEAKY